MPDREKRLRSGNRLIAATIVVLAAAILAYLFWPPDLGSAAAKMTAIGASVLVVIAIVLVVMIW